MADDPNYVQGGIFGGLTSQPLGWGSATGPTPAASSFDATFGAFPTLPALPSTFAPSATTKGNIIASSGGAGTDSTPISGAGPATAMPSNAAAGSQPVASNGVVSGSVADYFLRGVIIILGFIFVAIGLNMFRPGIVPNPVSVVRGKR